MGLFLMPRISIRSAAPLFMALRGLLAMIMLLLALYTGGFLDRIGVLASTTIQHNLDHSYGLSLRVVFPRSWNSWVFSVAY